MAEVDKSIQGYANGVFWERNTKDLQKKNINRKTIKMRNLRTSSLFMKLVLSYIN